MQREAICTDWQTRYRVCVMPPPSSGHLAVMQVAGLLEAAPPDGPSLVDGRPSPDFLHQYTEAARLAFADRDRYYGDPDFVKVPVAALADPADTGSGFHAGPDSCSGRGSACDGARGRCAGCGCGSGGCSSTATNATMPSRESATQSVAAQLIQIGA